MSASAHTPELIIEPGRATRNYWSDLWRYRELLGFLAWRDIQVRYKQTTLGILWALIQPAVTLVVFTFVFGKLANLPAGNTPYPLLVLAGLLPWQLFAAAFSNASGSLVANTHLISKVYFPRLLVPLSSIAVALIDFAVVLLLLVGMCVWWRFVPDWRIVALPLFIALALVTALGAGLWLTALTVKYRDFRFVVPFLLQVGLFLSRRFQHEQPAQLAVALFAEPDGRGDRRIPLVPASRRTCAQSGQPRRFRRHGAVPSAIRHPVFPAYRTLLCRCHLIGFLPGGLSLPCQRHLRRAPRHRETSSPIFWWHENRRDNFPPNRAHSLR
jgi:lipopolysaccharide transport system permease protein